jgi:hypothetical protein
VKKIIGAIGELISENEKMARIWRARTTALLPETRSDFGFFF